MAIASPHTSPRPSILMTHTLRSRHLRKRRGGPRYNRARGPMMQKISYAVLAVLVLFARLGLAQSPAHPRSVAITIDDGPAVNEMKDLGNFQRIARGLLSALEAEKVPATIFINERQINVQGQRDGRAGVLAQWLDAGYDLGNHTYSHPSLNKVSLREFEDD